MRSRSVRTRRTLSRNRVSTIDATLSLSRQGKPIWFEKTISRTHVPLPGLPATRPAGTRSGPPAAPSSSASSMKTPATTCSAPAALPAPPPRLPAAGRASAVTDRPPRPGPGGGGRPGGDRVGKPVGEGARRGPSWDLMRSFFRRPSSASPLPPTPPPGRRSHDPRYEVFDERARHGRIGRRRSDVDRSGRRRGGVDAMHTPNAVLDPRVAAATGAIGAAGLWYGLRTLERRLGERTTVLMGTMAAFVFAAQMVNFPLGPLAVSGHLLGGVLAAVMLGPWAGAVVIAAVLIVQCLLFGDGGLTALGANFVNMGLIGSVGRLRDLCPDPPRDRRPAG